MEKEQYKVTIHTVNQYEESFKLEWITHTIDSELINELSYEFNETDVCYPSFEFVRVSDSKKIDSTLIFELAKSIYMERIGENKN